MRNRRFNFISVFLLLLMGIPVVAAAQDGIRLHGSEVKAAARKASNQWDIGEEHVKQAAQLSADIVQALAGTPPTKESKELAAAITAKPSKKFTLEDTIEGSRPIKQLDNPASLITAPSEGGTVLLLPTP